MKEKKTILEVLGEGGSISLFEKNGKYFFQSNNSTLIDMLDEDDKEGLEPLNKSKVFSSFTEAFMALAERYPIFTLYPEFVDSEYIEEIEKAYLVYIDPQEENIFRSNRNWKKILKL